MSPTARTLSAIAAAYGIGLGLGLLAFKGTPVHRSRPNPLSSGHCQAGQHFEVATSVGGSGFSLVMNNTATCTSSTAHSAGNGRGFSVFLPTSSTIACTSY